MSREYKVLALGTIVRYIDASSDGYGYIKRVQMHQTWGPFYDVVCFKDGLMHAALSVSSIDPIVDK